MKICRYNDNRIGVVRGDQVHDVSAIVDRLPAPKYPFPIWDVFIEHLDELRPEMEKLADAAAPVAVSGVKLLSPVANPTKVIGTPTNYNAHIAEMKVDTSLPAGSTNRGSIDKAGLFLKANSSLIGPSEGVEIRFPDRRTDHEAELAVVIGKKCSDIPMDKIFDYVAGYAIGLDMVVRGPEDRSFRKSIDSYSVLGPWLVTKDEIADPDNLAFELTVNGVTKQKANTNDMIYDCAKQLSWATEFYTLYPGDILMTGTPEGVSQVKPGDTMHITMEGIGEMDVPCRAH